MPFRVLFGVFTLLLILESGLILAQSTDPFWDIVDPEVKRPKKSRKKKKNTTMKTTDTEFRNSLGIGLSVPEIFPLEYDYRISKNLSWHSFLVFPIPFNIRVELPRDKISSKDKVVIDQPELKIKLKAVYGPQFGTGIRWYPFDSGFYSRFGIAFRRLRLAGQVQSPIIITIDSVEITTQTELGIKVDAVTESLLSRFELGWRWNIGRSGYIDWIILGVALPTTTKNEVNVETYVDAPGDNDSIDGALGILKDQKESELKDKALSEMEPSTSKILPIMGIVVGFRF